MSSKFISVTLPEWAWLNGGEHEKGGDPLEGRNIVLHVRSASVIEFFDQGSFMPNGDVQSYGFCHKNTYGVTERHVAVLHYCVATNDKAVIDDILKAAAKWYCDYMRWEDDNILESDIASMN